MEVSAVSRFVRRTPRKARLVADSVKGMKVSEALAQLEFSPKHAAKDVAKAIKSAAAIMIVGALVLLPTSVGMTEASTI